MIDQRTVEALRLAVDRGDDSVLPVWADAMEDDNDPLTAGMRWIVVHGRKPVEQWIGHGIKEVYGWYESGVKGDIGRLSYAVERAVFLSLASYLDGWSGRLYDSRTEAYLALARALVKTGVVK